MPYANTEDIIQLFYEETGTGRPVIFVHEFAGDLRSWELQLRRQLQATRLSNVAQHSTTMRFL
jgi:pimeloyl-ACP methyl ester carboxylesterase